jgi:hypothetical protein
LRYLLAPRPDQDYLTSEGWLYHADERGVIGAPDLDALELAQEHRCELLRPYVEAHLVNDRTYVSCFACGAFLACPERENTGAKDPVTGEDIYIPVLPFYWLKTEAVEAFFAEHGTHAPSMRYAQPKSVDLDNFGPSTVNRAYHYDPSAQGYAVLSSANPDPLPAE